MGQQTNILSFDDAKRSGAAAVSTSARNSRKSTRPQRKRRVAASSSAATVPPFDSRSLDFARKASGTQRRDVARERRASRNAAHDERARCASRNAAHDERARCASRSVAHDERARRTSTHDPRYQNQAGAHTRSSGQRTACNQNRSSARMSRISRSHQEIQDAMLMGDQRENRISRENHISRENVFGAYAETNRKQTQARPAIMSYDDFLAEERHAASPDAADAPDKQPEATNNTRKKSLLQKISEAKRKHAKEKASKAFDRQFGGSSTSSANSAPRAAVYKGEMGPAQRRAQRMQPAGDVSKHARRIANYPAQPKSDVLGWISSAAGSISAAVTNRVLGDSSQANAGRLSGALPSVEGIHHNPQRQNRAGNAFTGISSAIFGTPRRIAALSVAACLVIAGMFMYPAAKQYYTEMRHLDQVQAEYDAVVDRNTELAATRDYLQSDAGIEEMAHEKYGWVNEGEHSVLVYGLPDDGAIADTNLSVKRGSVPAPETWYSVILDPFFGVE